MTRASTTLFWFSLTIFVSLGLYHTSYRVEELGRQLRTFNTDIEAEQRALHVLKAEWVFLSNPARIEEAARKHLDLKPTTPQQLTRLEKLSSVLPSRSEKMARAAMTAKAVASAPPRPAALNPKVAAEETGRLNTHMIMQKTAAVQDLAAASELPLNETDSFALATSGSVP